MTKIICTLVLCMLASCQRGSTSYTTRDFSCPGMEWRPIPLWFWNNTTVRGDEVERQLEQMVLADGYGGCAILPFGGGFGPGYLSAEYFEVYGRAVETARRLGAHMSVYDEYGFPSGSMGAINGSGVTTFMNNHPGYTVKRLDKTEFGVQGGARLERRLELRGRLMSLVAWNRGTNGMVNLRPMLQSEGELVWDVPEGEWTVMCFECVTDGDPNVDYLSQEAVSLFVHDTHEAYLSRLPGAFRGTVVSTFFDEPTMYRAQGRMWTDDFNERYEQAYGSSPELLYPALWYDIGPVTAAARNRLFGLRSELYARAFMGTISQWAAGHGILATGHQDQEEIANPTSVAGDLMKAGKYLSMPGIDKIGGGRPTEDFYKVVSSSANCWDKDYVMSETYGAMGNIPVETMYQVAVEQYTKGVNHLIPHAVWYDDRNVTFLPELSWRNPLYNAELPRFNRFLSRLNYMLARPGRHVADVAVIYPIETQYAGHYLDGPRGYYEGGVAVPGTDYPMVSRLLTDSLGVDFTYLHPEVLDDRCLVEGGRLRMQNRVNSEEFSVVILPGMDAISAGNLQRVEEAWRAGVTVVFTTQTPSRSADLEGDDEAVRQAVARMLQGQGGRPALFVPRPTASSLAAALAERTDVPDVCFSGGEHPFNYLHKVIRGRDVYLFGNIDATPCRLAVTLRRPMQGALLMDPHTGLTSEPELAMTADGRLQLQLSLQPNRAVFLVDGALVGQNGVLPDGVGNP